MTWWRCDKGHSFSMRAAFHTTREQSCPYCARRKVLAGYNDLATVEPRIAAEWHPTLNGSLTPEMVTAGSRKKVWWQCALGHVWKAAIYPPDRQAALRLPRLRRQNESREDIKINACRKADFI